MKDYGNRVTCLCPFHFDNKSSVVVFKESNIFNCSACNIKYNYYDFIKEIEGISDTKKIMEIANNI
ncbi:CHC2 zinc finger domain-containing protein [uncultured Methanobrevibacter sp.]|uniref:CHC2 zinc finger domain-containing protein n=1 Tax=uncultured Methanobrevibacter sp. TaxID=253161 RepID=UPI0034304D16